MTDVAIEPRLTSTPSTPGGRGITLYSWSEMSVRPGAPAEYFTGRQELALRYQVDYPVDTAGLQPPFFSCCADWPLFRLEVRKTKSLSSRALHPQVVEAILKGIISSDIRDRLRALGHDGHPQRPRGWSPLELVCEKA